MSAALKGCRILVVEDNFLLAETLRDLLEDCGCQLIGPAPRVAAALPLCTRDLDGALLDINLGSETCFDVADRLSEQGIPFMFLSGYSDAAIVPARFDGVPRLAKPYDREAIIREAAHRFAVNRQPAGPGHE
jgi:CheY-like chemotaxis protein